MANIKCPLCDTVNSADAEVCFHCGASLPAVDMAENNASDSSERDNLFDDLRDLGGIPEGDGSESEQFETPDADDLLSSGEEPEWLKRIQRLSGQEANISEDKLQQSEEDVPDWIRSLAQEEEPAPPEAEEPEAGDLTDIPPDAFDLPSEETETHPDWLHELDNWSPPESETAADPEDKVPEEISSETSDASEESEETEHPGHPGQPGQPLQPLSDDDLPEWLRSMGSTSALPDEPGDEVGAVEEEREIESDFLSSLSGADTGPESKTPSDQEDEGLPDWLSLLEHKPPEPEQPLPSEAGREPEWTEDEAEVSGAAQGEISGRAVNEPEDPFESIRLSGSVSVPAEDEDDEFTSNEEEADIQELSGQDDWRQLREEKPPSETGEEDVLPDWMRSEHEPASDPEPDDIQFDDETQNDGNNALPDWLSADQSAGQSAGQSADQSAGQSAGQSDKDAGENLPEEKSENEAFEAGSLSDWLGGTVEDAAAADTEAGEQPEQERNDSPPKTPPFFRDELGNWIDTPGEESLGESREAEKSRKDTPRQPDENALPNWIDEPGAEEEPEPFQKEAPGKPGLIKEAALPDWLAAMRPIESVLPEQIDTADEKKIEEAGPLAGLQGVLPTLDAAGHYRKPPVYSLKLQVSDKQRAHAAMLENLLEEEKRAVTGKRSVKRSPQRLLRAFIGLALIAAILLPLLGIPAAGMKVGQVSNTVGFYDAIEALPAGSSALIAVDYAPGFSGEMRFAATGMLQRLMMRGIRIGVISTLPSGPVLADGLMMRALERQPEMQDQYTQRDWYINLGYLPGEAISLQELARRPQQAIQYGISAGLDNRLVWDSDVLQNIQELEDFGAVIVITDTVETGRTWIEQVEPSLEDTPFLIVSSAQAAPMLLPYLQSGQVQGLLSGMAGGISYEETTQIPGLDRGEYWLANQFGLAVVILILILGVIMESTASLAGQNRPDQEV